MVKRTLIIILLLSIVYECNNLLTMDKIELPEKFSKAALYSFILSLGIKYPEIVYAQAKIETGNFHSKLFRESFNLFGMKHSSKHKSVSTGLKNGYNVYNSWKASVIDYKLWQDRMIHKINNEQAYLFYLQEHYADSGEAYITLIKKMK
jgi:uncharacterized FlgJ-related protein